MRVEITPIANALEDETRFRFRLHGAAPLSGDHAGFYVGRNAVNGIFGVNAKAKDVELAVKFLDYAMSPEVAEYIAVAGAVAP